MICSFFIRMSRAKISIEVSLSSYSRFYIFMLLCSCLYIYVSVYGLNFILAVQFFDRNHEILEFYADFDDSMMGGNFSYYRPNRMVSDILDFWRFSVYTSTWVSSFCTIVAFLYNYNIYIYCFFVNFKSLFGFIFADSTQTQTLYKICTILGGLSKGS